MKRLFIILIGMLLIPMITLALTVDESTAVEYWEVSSEPDAASLCNAEEAKYDYSGLASAEGSGFYLYCEKVACTNSVYTHTIAHPISSVLTCSNGNTDPYTEIVNSSTTDSSYAQGAACTTSGDYLYGTVKMKFNCNYLSNETAYVPSGGTPSTDPTTPSGNTDPTTPSGNQDPTTPSGNQDSTTPAIPDDGDDEYGDDDEYDGSGSGGSGSSSSDGSSSNGTKAPDTGVEDYFIVLGVSIVGLSLVMYFVNKKSVFQKI